MYAIIFSTSRTLRQDKPRTQVLFVSADKDKAFAELKEVAFQCFNSDTIKNNLIAVYSDIDEARNVGNFTISFTEPGFDEPESPIKVVFSFVLTDQWNKDFTTSVFDTAFETYSEN